MTTTAKNLTHAQIRALRSEAEQAGDAMQIAVCDLAMEDGAEALTQAQIYAGERDYTGADVRGDDQRRLNGMTQDEAREECARVIAATESQS